MIDLNELRWQEPAPWDDTRRLWLRDNLMSYEQMQEFVFETEEFKNCRKVVDEAINSANYAGRSYVDCGGDFADWLWNSGGSYIQNFDAQDVLVWAVKDELDRYGFDVVEDAGWPVRIQKRR